MLETPERIGARFSILLFLGFLLTPVAGFSATVLFDIVSLPQLREVLAAGVPPAVSIFLIFFSLFQIQRLITPLTTWALQHPGGGNPPTRLYRLIERFSPDFWGLMALHVLVSPLLVFWTLDGGITTSNGPAYMHFFLLQAASTTLIGIPAYLFGLHQLGKLAGQLNLDRVHVSLKSRILLLTGVVPLLAYTLLVDYYWLLTGTLDAGYLAIWLALGILSAAISLLSIRSVQQALRPFHQLFSRSGASTHENLAQLKPASTDEIGYLTQTLGKVFMG